MHVLAKFYLRRLMSDRRALLSSEQRVRMTCISKNVLQQTAPTGRKGKDARSSHLPSFPLPLTRDGTDNDAIGRDARAGDRSSVLAQTNNDPKARPSR
jgi:hypothetical protein